MQLKKRRIGGSSLEVSPLCLGGNVFGWTIDEAASFKVLDAFVDAGFEFIDTADLYSRWAPGNQGGESETIIGNWATQRGNRDKLIIATKVGMEMGPGEKGLSRAYILQAAERSLRRLQTDHIDLYQSHADDEQTPQEETMEAFAQLVKQGKVRAIGASNFSADRLASALQVSRDKAYPSYQCLQPHYNLVERAGFEEKLEPLCLKENIGVIGYFSLASGFLTGKYRSDKDLGQSPRGNSVKKYLNDRGLRILSALDQVAKATHSNPTRVALAWLIARPSVTAPIASATKVEQLQDLIESTRLTLDPQSIAFLNAASA